MTRLVERKGLVVSSRGCARDELPVFLGGRLRFAARQARHNHLRTATACRAQVEADGGERRSRQAPSKDQLQPEAEPTADEHCLLFVSSGRPRTR